jgi:hypothetical protein
MKIIEENPLKIYPSKQTIDKKLGLPPPFDDRNQVIVVTGGQGTGKTTWLHSALTCRKQDGRIFSGRFEKVFYATPEECFTSEADHCMKNHIKSRLFHSFDETMLNSVVEQALENKHENDGQNSILVIDDFSEEYKNPSTIRLLKKIINKHRHYHLTILLSTLNMKNVPKPIRSLVDSYIIFKPKGLIELEDYTTEIFALSKNELNLLLDFVFDAPHNFLMYNNRHNKFYKNFDLLSQPPQS